MAQKQGSTVRAYEQDPHGDLSVITDTTGTPTGTISYDPWGTVDAAIGTDAQQSLLGYQSQPTDPTTGLTDMGTRRYDPAMGRFTERDTIYGDPSSPLTLNQYAYANDSPLVYSDPTGMYADPTGCQDAKCYDTVMKGSAGGTLASEGGDPSKCTYCQSGHPLPPGQVYVPAPKPAPMPPTPPGPTAWNPQNPTAKFYPTSRPHFSFLGEWKPGYACQIAAAARGFGAHCGSDEAFADTWQKDLGLGAVYAAPFLGALALDALAAGGAEEAGGLVFRSNTSHIFRDAAGHLAEDTPANRALLRRAVEPQNIVGETRLPGTVISRYRQLLPDGQQVWVEVRNGTEITNGGVNPAAGP
jgi:RHS repeat-associated protein